MKRPKAFVMGIVLVFMFISQLLYFSVLAYNQIQSQRYIGFVRHYQQQMMLNVSRQLLTITDKEQQLFNHVRQTIGVQEKYLTSRRSIIEREEIAPQLQLVILNDNGIEKMGILMHRLFIAEEMIEELNLSDLLMVDGTILANQKYVPYELSPTQNLLEQLEIDLLNLGYQVQSRSKRNYQTTLTYQRPVVQKISFNYGAVAIRPQNEELQLTVFDNHQQEQVRTNLPKEQVKYLIESHWIIYEQPPR